MATATRKTNSLPNLLILLLLCGILPLTFQVATTIIAILIIIVTITTMINKEQEYPRILLLAILPVGGPTV